MYVSEIEGPRRRGVPVVRWKDRVKEEYMHERVADRGGGRGGGSSAVAITLGDFSFLVDICDESIDFFFFMYVM